MSDLLHVQRLGVTHDSATLLDDVSFSADAGEFIGIVGPNGAGKSTLLRAIAAIERPSSGGVAINGCSVQALSPIARARALAFLPQQREVHWAVTAEAVAALGRFAYGAPSRLNPADRAAVERAIEDADVGALRHRVMQTLSGGEQARVHLARTLAAQTPVILADEPTAALDPKHALGILTALQAKAKAGGLVLAALHDLDLATRFCSRIIVLHEGRIVIDDTPAKALAEEIIAACFSVTARRVGAEAMLMLSLPEN